MPGTSLVSRTAFRKHEAALRELGLVDDAGKPTWMTNGSPDMMKMLAISAQHIQAIPVTERASIERQLFGAQGSGALAVLADPRIEAMIPDLVEAMNKFSSGSKYFAEMTEHSPLQVYSETWGELRGVLTDIGDDVLPKIIPLLRAFDTGLKNMDTALVSGGLGAMLGFAVGERNAGRGELHALRSANAAGVWSPPRLSR